MSPSSKQLFSAAWRSIVILALLQKFGLLPPRRAPHIHAAPAETGFLAASESQQRRRGVEGKKTTSKSPAIHTAMDAAMALNSIPFMEMLAGTKNSADVRTFTRSIERSGGAPTTRRTESSSVSFWTFFRRLFSANEHNDEGEDGIVPTRNDESQRHRPRGHHRCTSPPPSHASDRWMSEPSPCPSHETVAEYVGRLWFMNDNNNNRGIRFRETIKVVSLSHDGKTATVECRTEYFDGSAWVSCCRIVCEFSSRGPSGEKSEEEEEGNNVDLGLKMTLDCELLVWLPLPGSASRAVRKKIGSVFESVALDFFDERARISLRRHGR